MRVQAVGRLLRSRSAAGVIDAAVVSVLSLLIVLVAARVGGNDAVGTLALASTLVLLSLGFYRMLVGLPLLAEFPGGGSRSRGAAWGLGLVFAGALVVPAALAAVVLESGLPLLIGCWAALAVLQDAQRYACMLEHRYGRLVALDVVLLVASGLLLARAASAEQMIVLLSCGLVIALVAGALMVRLSPSPVTSRAVHLWRTRLAGRARPLALDGAFYTVAAQGSLWIVASRASVAEVGALRLAMLFAFPFSILMAGLTNRLVQKASQQSPADARSQALRAAAGLAALGTVLAVALAALAPFVIDFASSRDIVVPLPAVLFTLAGSALLLAALPLFSLAVAETRVLAVAVVRAVAGVLLLGAVGLTALGLSADGAAAATALANLTMLSGIVAVALGSRGPSPGGPASKESAA